MFLLLIFAFCAITCNETNHDISLQRLVAISYVGGKSPRVDSSAMIFLFSLDVFKGSSSLHY